MPAELVLVRHGATGWSEERKHTGRSDIPLTDAGRAQAEHIAGALKVFDVRRCFAQVSSLAELEDLLAALDRDTTVVPGGERIRRGHTNGPIRVALPDGFLDDIDALEHDVSIPDDDGVYALSGG